MQQPLSRGRTPPWPVCCQQLQESFGTAALRAGHERIAIEQPSGARMQEVASERCIIPGFRDTRGERLPVNGLRSGENLGGKIAHTPTGGESHDQIGGID